METSDAIDNRKVGGQTSQDERGGWNTLRTAPWAYAEMRAEMRAERVSDVLIKACSDTATPSLPRTAPDHRGRRADRRARHANGRLPVRRCRGRLLLRDLPGRKQWRRHR